MTISLSKKIGYDIERKVVYLPFLFGQKKCPGFWPGQDVVVLGFAFM